MRMRRRVTSVGIENGFSLVELLVAMTISLIILGAAVAAFDSSLGMRKYQGDRTDAITAAQAALNLMTREIGNSGYGLEDGLLGNNGLVLGGDSTVDRIHFRANVNNSNGTTTDPGEDVTYYFDSTSKSIVRHDPNVSPSTSGVINDVSRVQFIYYPYDATGVLPAAAASTATGRVNIRLTVMIDSNDANDTSNPRNVTLESDVTLRNSPYNLGQY